MTLREIVDEAKDSIGKMETLWEDDDLSDDRRLEDTRWVLDHVLEQLEERLEEEGDE